MEHGFYHPDRGYWQTNGEPTSDILASYPEGTTEVGIQPSALHVYDGTAWIPPTQEAITALEAQIERGTRDHLLRTVVDPIVTNPLRWAEMTDAQRQAWSDYRRALLDVPEQVGFPLSIVWPEQPA